jgi:hypothetical protein
MMELALAALLSGAARDSVKYVGYEVAMQPGYGTMCGWHSSRQNKLMLDGPKKLRILFRVDHGKVEKMLLATEDCEIDAGGQAVVMLPGITAAQSVEYLASREDDSGFHAISAHQDSVAAERLIAIARDRKNPHRQKKAFFWLARSKDVKAERFIESILR